MEKTLAASQVEKNSTEHTAIPLVAIVGRPNVGKSTLFNRLVGRMEAIVAAEPGTTRDRITAEVAWKGRAFILVDTGGLEPNPQDQLRQKVKAQVAMAVQDADLVLFVLDARQGVTPLDQDAAGWLRRFNKPVLLVANKVDTEGQQLAIYEFYRLGYGDSLAVSAYHNLGIYDLLDRVIGLLPPAPPEPTQDIMRVCILGRPNVGKSMLLNAVLGEERAIVSEVPGTTRDATDTSFTWKDNKGLLIDTAGIRRRGRIGLGIERYSVLRAVKAIHRSNIALVVLDASEAATAQDTHIAGLAWEAYKGVILVVNKWDLAPKETGLEQEQYLQAVRKRFHFVPYAPIIFTSALLKQGIGDLMDTVLELYAERKKMISQRQLSSLLAQALSEHLPPPSSKGRVRFFGVKQTGINPPGFTFEVNDPALIHFSYRRYLEGRLRTGLGYRHSRLKLTFKARQR
jgi:GTP-binding protein